MHTTVFYIRCFTAFLPEIVRSAKRSRFNRQGTNKINTKTAIVKKLKENLWLIMHWL